MKKRNRTRDTKGNSNLGKWDFYGAINKDEIFLNRSEIKKEAARLHEMGYNCAQSVVCAMA